jgi:adenylate kinase
MDAGALVSDAIVIELIRDQLAAAERAGGAIFDGFPRTIAQAQALDRMLEDSGSKIDRVIRLRVEDGALMERITVRFAESGRPDDNPASFKVRLEHYNEQTAPLLPYYAQQGKLVEVNGMAGVASVAAEIDAVLESIAA